ncbi:NADH-quinone oxidoreductase subunit NuoN [Alkalilimnicola ehrlichii]|uniref:NADH-quinone oxidoreductase subunit NuoN n=1 Tax=Alkalilimnicola ehrlichii TaxID=351052 RepID=UPI003BA001AA
MTVETPDFVMPDFSLALPEIWMLVMACVVLVVDLYSQDSRRGMTFMLTQFTLVVAGVLAIVAHWGEPAVTFSGTYVSDHLAAVLKVAIAGLGFLSFAYCRDYLEDRGLLKAEYFVLGLFSLLGMMIMASAHNLMTVYLGLELLALTLYAMVAFNRDNLRATEAAMKYFVLGAIASGILLYGMSLIYGATGSLNLAEVAVYAGEQGANDWLLLLGMTLVVVGVAFKFGAVPFHTWMPDVYQGAPTTVALFASTAPKVAAVALFVRLLSEGLGPIHDQWQPMIILLAVASLVVGNLAALAQTNIKRMLAYSTASHVGFILLGFIAGTAEGYSSALFYAITYGIMSAGAFGLIILLSHRGFEAENISDFKGLNDRSPAMALMMLLLMFSMTGIPGTIGFYAKWLVLKSVVDVGLVWLAVFAVVFAVIGAFYYLRVLKFVYFDKPETEEAPQGGSMAMRGLLVANGIAVLLLGIFPDSLISVCMAAFGVSYG